MLKYLVLKAIAFASMLLLIVFANLWVFRSDTPYITIFTIIGSVMLLVIFPYNNYFKQNEKR